MIHYGHESQTQPSMPALGDLSLPQSELPSTGRKSHHLYRFTNESGGRASRPPVRLPPPCSQGHHFGSSDQSSLVAYREGISASAQALTRFPGMNPVRTPQLTARRGTHAKRRSFLGGHALPRSSDRKWPTLAVLKISKERTSRRNSADSRRALRIAMLGSTRCPNHSQSQRTLQLTSSRPSPSS